MSLINVLHRPLSDIFRVFPAWGGRLRDNGRA
ncbi:hypothetical protein T11_2036 [Trichinella zimbabwensis]|uniref:Uncharacterized protein n=1 Tax=Trichinella zimbabwensis TaxID=268475 RepID=A0A0V1GAC1_9BILA|nr:hypothetical protein T11_2036 [Trichinella zimbabwensis]